ncbi:hypothetical protein ACQP2T_17075 [Nonomuraea sp. CA-143628]|uniref:hypothetical protein n=1 Tax=Nonomuraea sp. CA-143628 TaxID=3239997 RepID=UPI003D9367DB
MPEVKTTIENWAGIHYKNLALNVIEFGKPSYNYWNKGEAGTWLFLEGFTVKLDGEVYNAHLTITKKPTMDLDGLNWTYCHLTVDRKSKNHVFYKVDEDGGFETTQTLYDGEGKQRGAATHYANDQINHATLMSQMDHDMRLIFAHLV